MIPKGQLPYAEPSDACMPRNGSKCFLAGKTRGCMMTEGVAIGTAKASSVKLHGIRPRIYIEYIL